MTDLRFTKGPKPGTIVVSVDELEAMEERWRQTRDNQVESMNNLLKKIEELQAQQGEDAATIAGLTGELVEAEKAIALVGVKLDLITEERDAALSAVRVIQGVIKQADLTHDGNAVSGPAEVTWERRIDVLEPVDEAAAAIEEQPPALEIAEEARILLDRMGEDRPASRLSTPGGQSSGRHASLT